jgi:hypothetical protein
LGDCDADVPGEAELAPGTDEDARVAELARQLDVVDVDARENEPDLRRKWLDACSA